MLLPLALTAFATEAPAVEPEGSSKYTGTTKDDWKAYYEGLNTTQYDVTCADGLVALVEIINAASDGFSAKTVSLKCDLIFNEGDASTWETTAPANVFSWTPIANFKGTFNGNGYTVSGLYINTSEDVYSGFFGCLKDGAQVSNLGVVNSYMNNTSTALCMGGIAGSINGKNVKIEGCYSNAILQAGSASIDTSAVVGGIVGLVEDTVAIADTLDRTTAALISQCAFDGTAVANTSGSKHCSVGGIVGMLGTKDRAVHTAHDELIIRDCVNFGSVSNNKNKSTQTMAGILGLLENGKNAATTPVYVSATVERCLNFGTATTTGDSSGYSTHANALVGQIRNADKLPTKPELIVNGCFIFTDLAQSFFALSTSLNALQFKLNDTLIALSTDTASPDPNDYILTTAHIIASSDTVKTTLPDGYTNWTVRTGNVNAEYPLPTTVYDNFFKVELKYVQSTDVDSENKYTVRIIAEVDSENYNAAGFEVIDVQNNRKLDVDTNSNGGVKVYKTVTSGNEESYTARGDRLYITVTISNLEGAAELKITPYTYGDAANAATKVTGASKTLTFNANGVCTNVQ